MFHIRSIKKGDALKQTWEIRLPGRMGIQTELERYLELVRLEEWEVHSRQREWHEQSNRGGMLCFAKEQLAV